MPNACGKQVNYQRIPVSKTCVHASPILLRVSTTIGAAWISTPIIHWVLRIIRTEFPLHTTSERPLEMSTFSTISTGSTIYHHQLITIKG